MLARIKSLFGTRIVNFEEKVAILERKKENISKKRAEYLDQSSQFYKKMDPM